MKKQIEKSQILSIYVLLAQKLGYIYLKNREKNSTIELGKRFLLDMREKTFTKFIIPLLEKFIKPEILI